MNKRGLSNFIIVLIFIMLAIVALIFLYNLVDFFLQQQQEISTAQEHLILEQMTITKVKFNPLNPSALDIDIQKVGGKVILEGTETIPGSGLAVDIVSVSDLSASMAFKLPETKNANKELVNSILGLEGDNRISLVCYNSSIMSRASLDFTDSIAQLNNKIDLWAVAFGGTCICCGINNASQKFQSGSASEKSKAMIVMSDGEANVQCAQQGTGDAKQDAIKAACDANSSLSNFVIYSIGFGSSADAATLTEIAKCGGGEYYYSDIGNLISVYKKISEQIIKKYRTIATISYLKIVFSNNTASYLEIINNPPKDPYEIKNYIFNLQGKISNVQKIEIYPVLLTPSGKEVIGPLLSTWKAK